MRAGRALIVAIFMMAPMTPAHSETVYAYWSYWQGDAGTWKYATLGPASAPALDGAVDGWRFTLGSDGRAARPAMAPDFDAVCGSVPKTSDAARVAIFIDYGSASVAQPASHCAVVATGLTRASALTSVAALRLNNGFVCAINGTPEDGCGEAVQKETPAPPKSASPAAKATSPATQNAPQPTAQPTVQPTARTPHSTRTAAASTPNASPTSTSPSSTNGADATGQAVTSLEDASNADASPLPTVVTMLLAAIVVILAWHRSRREGA